ncbi:hypothetical protein [Acinetobacter sp. c1-l78]|uniref:hypothetical protein n=1 Tax=Acinetobacter sp. c1-l78 TaxID=3342803 RepID=UPI0035B70ED8
MMRYILAIFLLLLTAITSKISYDLYYTERQNNRILVSQVEQQNLEILALKDKLVAVNQSQTNNSNNSSATSSEDKALLSATQHQTFDEQQRVQQYQWVQDRLLFIDSLIKQQKLDIALLQMISLREDLSEHPRLAQSLNQAMIDALNKDQQQLVAFLQKNTSQQQALNILLQQVRMQLAQNPSLDQIQNSSSESSQWHWRNWFSISKTEKIPALTERHLQFRYIELSLLLTQNALSSGQSQFYQQQLLETISRLESYPDTYSQNLAKQLQAVLQQHLANVAIPTLSALNLMQNQTAPTTDNHANTQNNTPTVNPANQLSMTSNVPASSTANPASDTVSHQ